MEGIFYYWIMWGAFIAAAFLWKKSAERTIAVFFILINLASSQMFIHTSSFSVGMAYLEIWGLSFGLIAVKRYFTSFSFLLLAFAMMAGYTAIMLFQLFDPVWFIIDRFYILLILFGGLSLYFGKDFLNRLSLFIVALSQGEFLYWAVLRHFYDGLTIGGHGYLDLLAAGGGVIGIWSAVEYFSHNAGQYVYKKQNERQG
ncbi:YphA family membrane protein [Metabacillus sp. RGM 3146]|uniref:YphA family membrane protein n=1 Tax=Metabacillus sp. RGM 3146 TaxID=3401092 RepID=UPI003B9CE2D8